MSSVVHFEDDFPAIQSESHPAAQASVEFRHGLHVKSSGTIGQRPQNHTSKYHELLVQNPKFSKKFKIRSRSTARRALSFARAVRDTLHAEEVTATRRISEAEEYLGILRAKHAIAQMKVVHADEQVGIVREVMDSDGIPEECMSSDEEDSGDEVPSSCSLQDVHRLSSDLPCPTTSSHSSDITEDSLNERYSTAHTSSGQDSPSADISNAEILEAKVAVPAS